MANNVGLRRRDSFSDRFCDDLTELIIGYLPTEDKFRFEVVSKQFQRLIYNKVFTLNLNLNARDKHNLKNLFRPLVPFREYCFQIDTQLLALVLRKCKFIDEINLFQELPEDDDIGYVSITNIAEVLTQISDNCKGLNTFSYNSYNFRHFEYFGQALGHRIKCLELADPIGSRHSPNLTKFCINLESLTNIYLKDIFFDNQLISQSLKRLLNLQIFDFGKEYPLLKTLISQSIPQLTHLSVDLSLDTCDEESTTIESLSQLTSLRVLRIHSNLSEDYSWAHLPKAIKAIAVNCKQLKEFQFNTIFRDSFDSNAFCQSFAHFSGLKRFSLGYFKNQSGEFDFKCLKNCQQLTHLTIGLMKINNNCFEGFGSLFPQLKSLTMTNENRLSDQTIALIKDIKSLAKSHILNTF